VVLGYLLARGAEYDLMTAARIGDVERVTELLDANPKLVNQVPPYSTYYSGLPLWLAAKGGYYELVKLLLERGANPNEPEPVAPEGHSLYAAVSNKHIQIARLLLEHGANPNAAVESSGDVMWMARNAGQEMVDLLASYGGGFSLELCTYDGDIATISTVLRANPSLRLKPSWIQNVVSRGHEAVLRLFLKHDPDAVKDLTLGDTQDVKIVRILMDHGLNPNTPNWLGIAPLHRLAREGNTEIAALCLERGADINARDLDNSATPLAWAVRFGKRTMVKFLLEHDAAVSLPDDEPWNNPKAIAEREGHLEISEVLG
jgi:ankyrin repeat protein